MRSTRALLLCATMLVAVPAASFGAGKTAGAVEQTGGTMVLQNPTLRAVKLTPAQREQVRKILLTKHTEVEFRIKAAKSAKDFTPHVGAKLPTGVKPDGLPSNLTQAIPQLADYGYAKMKDQILLVNEMTGKIVEIIPETQPQTTGQQ